MHFRICLEALDNIENVFRAMHQNPYVRQDIDLGGSYMQVLNVSTAYEY